MDAILTDPKVMHIRAFARSDTEVVIQLWETCGLTRPWNDPRKDIERKLLVQPELFVVGELDSHIVASAMGGYDGHRGHVYYLAVAPDQSGKGLGRALMTHLETEFVSMGCPKTNVFVRADNTVAAGFYEKLGFVRETSPAYGHRLISDV
ncbi:GNAT family acetyltransferase [Pelagibacterium halotolerans]|uniref:GNAT family acetyltransferase n=1 Tax=Pelagibacterium halotolerans TaxID=531813 RepID=UPI0038517C13